MLLIAQASVVRVDCPSELFFRAQVGPPPLAGNLEDCVHDV